MRKNLEQVKSKSTIITDPMAYMPPEGVVKAIPKKSTGYADVLSFVQGEVLKGKTPTLDLFAKIIEGQAEIIIGGVSYFLMTGAAVRNPLRTPDGKTPDKEVDLGSKAIKIIYQ